MRAPLELAEIIKQRITNDLIKKLPQGWGFTLILNSYGSGGFCTYISNCNRQDMIKALKEMTYELENEEEVR